MKPVYSIITRDQDVIQFLGVATTIRKAHKMIDEYVQWCWPISPIRLVECSDDYMRYEVYWEVYDDAPSHIDEFFIAPLEPNTELFRQDEIVCKTLHRNEAI